MLYQQGMLHLTLIIDLYTLTQSILIITYKREIYIKRSKKESNLNEIFLRCTFLMVHFGKFYKVLTITHYPKSRNLYYPKVVFMSSYIFLS